MLRWALIFAISVATFGVSLAASSEEAGPRFENADLTAASVRMAIDRYGANAVVRELWGRETDNGFAVVLDRIAAGDQEWLDLVPLLDPGADGHASESLLEAQSLALAVNPIGVLRLISPARTVSQICMMRQIEPTQAEFENFYERTIAAVQAVSAPDLQRVKAACLNELQDSRIERAEFVQP